VSNYSRLTDGWGGGGSALPCGPCPRPCLVDPSRMSGAASQRLLYVPSIIISLTSLDSCKFPVEYDLSYVRNQVVCALVFICDG
jgi:hypothetical protein